MADQLFATLDPTVAAAEAARRAPVHRHATRSGSSASCRTTWWRRSGRRSRRSRLAELIVHVADASSPERRRADRRRAAGAGRDRRRRHPRGPGAEQDRPAHRLRAGPPRAPLPGSVPVSALTGEGIEGLLGHAGRGAAPSARRGHAAGARTGARTSIARLYRDAEVLATRHEGEGTSCTHGWACASWPRSASSSRPSGAGAPERPPLRRSAGGFPCVQRASPCHGPVITSRGSARAPWPGAAPASGAGRSGGSAPAASGSGHGSCRSVTVSPSVRAASPSSETKPSASGGVRVIEVVARAQRHGRAVQQVLRVEPLGEDARALAQPSARPRGP